ncbi:hypothetical protein [Photobacterium leiognathi]|uniref:hypothetical protein n=1 Tax=Photobacterium leiognathi TaxID=553611 RepID=UPI0029824A6C|nr:hypothetical protein [Photobacterium leiognathi]
MKTIIKSPTDCTDNEIDTFVRMTEEGGQVRTYQLRSKILRAQKLVFIYDNESCVAIAALKTPADSYKAKVFNAADVQDKLTSYHFEIGYIYATVSGVGNQLMEGVIEASEESAIFATTRDSNAVMQHLLPKFGLNKLGKSYKNDSGKYLLGLFGNET